MNVHAIPRGNFEITDLVEMCDDPMQGVKLGVAVAKVWIAQSTKFDPANDAILDKVEAPKDVAQILVHVLSSIDAIYFDLSARMLANVLVKKRGNIGSTLGYMTAVRLTYKRPHGPRLKTARDIGILFALANTCRLGLKPTERPSKKPSAPLSNSGSRLIQDLISEEEGEFVGNLTIKTIGQVWDNRRSILMKAGFKPEDVSRFLERFKGTN